MTGDNKNKPKKRKYGKKIDLTFHEGDRPYQIIRELNKILDKEFNIELSVSRKYTEKDQFILTSYGNKIEYVLSIHPYEYEDEKKYKEEVERKVRQMESQLRVNQFSRMKDLTAAHGISNLMESQRSKKKGKKDKKGKKKIEKVKKEESNKLTYEQRVQWFVDNCETSMELDIMLESMRDDDLDNFMWHGEVYKIPATKDELEKLRYGKGDKRKDN